MRARPGRARLEERTEQLISSDHCCSHGALQSHSIRISEGVWLGCYSIHEPYWRMTWDWARQLKRSQLYDVWFAPGGLDGPL